MLRSKLTLRTTLSSLSGVVLACTVMMMAMQGAEAATANPSVQTKYGLMHGTYNSGVESFKGIAYALPPIGALRWRPPQSLPLPVMPSQVEVNARAFGPACPQIARMAARDLPQSEDCLTLNIWRPAGFQKSSKNPNLPVMVWIHGGAFIGGSAAEPLYDGSRLAKKGVLVVSMNYRLGRLGFFAHPALSATRPQGETEANYGFMDQIAALNWVKNNIASFGGDPSQVTIFGQSAGGASVNFLTVIPSAKNLFVRAISQSGFPRWAGRYLTRGPTSAEAIGVEYAHRHNIGGTMEQQAAALRALPVAALTENDPPEDIDRTTPMPIVDGQLLTAPLPDLLKQGKMLPVPLMVGGTSCDASVYGSDALALFTFASYSSPIFKKLYPGPLQPAVREAQTDRIETEPVRFQAQAWVASGLPVWMYYFDHANAEEGWQGAGCRGAPHAAELPYVFGNLDNSYNNQLTIPAGKNKKNEVTITAQSQEASRLSDQMMAYWVSFAKTGVPDAQALAPVWPQYVPQQAQVLEFGRQNVFVTTHFRQAQLDWIASKLSGLAVW